MDNTSVADVDAVVGKSEPRRNEVCAERKLIAFGNAAHARGGRRTSVRVFKFGCLLHRLLSNGRDDARALSQARHRSFRFS